MILRTIPGMGVSLSIGGSVPAPEARRDLLRWAAGRAAELEWNVRAVELKFKKARIRSGPKTRWLEMPHASGISLLPHFACEEVPLVFLDGGGELVEELVEDHGTEAPTFLAGAIVKTQFAGPAVHREICEFLREGRSRFAPGLSIDDETGFAAGGDERALERAFILAWEDIHAKIEEDRPRAGSRFQVGGFPFELPTEEPGGEFAKLDEKQREILLAAERAFVTRFGGFGTTLDRSRASVVDLELAISDVDDADFDKDPASPAVEALALEAGAYFGRTVVAALGGVWRAGEGELTLADVGRSGLIVDPFQVARDRIAGGPPFAFTNHLAVYDTIAGHFARER
jgi:hypothetical protein